MSLLTTWGDFNKIESRKLSQEYTAEWYPERGYRTWPYYELHRITKKSYSYVGMDEATAVACAAAKREQLTYTWVVEKCTDAGTSKSKITKIAGDVTVNHGDGDMFNVEIEINADDVVYKSESYVNLNALPTYFAPFPDTDESVSCGGSIYAKNIEVDGDGNVYLNYTAYIEEFDYSSSNFKVESSNDGATWTTFAPAQKSTSYVKLYSSIPSSVPAYFRLVWAGTTSVTSNVLITPTLSLPSVTISNLRYEPSTLIVVVNEWMFNFTASFGFNDSAMYVEWSDDTPNAAGVYETWVNDTNWERYGAGFVSAPIKTGDLIRHRSLRAYRVRVVNGETSQVISNVIRTPFDPEDTKYAGDWSGVEIETCEWTAGSEYGESICVLNADSGVTIDDTKGTYFCQRWDSSSESWVDCETVVKTSSSISCKTPTTMPLAIRVCYEGHKTTPVATSES